MKKKTKQPNKQEVALRYIRENYLDFGRLRRDLISDQVQIQNPDGTWRDFNTVDINDIVCNCSLETGIQITPKEVQQVTISSHVPSVHPLRDYVYACENPKYYSPGGPDWIDWLAQQVSVEGDEQEQLFWRMCFKKWFVAMVASWLYDDVVNHQVLILIGPQGIFKTTWLEFLIPPELRMYGCKMGNNTYLNKDDKLRVAEFGLINLDEIDAYSTRELNAMKSLITTTDVSERAAYRYNKEKRIRIASFCASGNKPEFLTISSIRETSHSRTKTSTRRLCILSIITSFIGLNRRTTSALTNTTRISEHRPMRSNLYPSSSPNPKTTIPMRSS